MTDKIHQLDGTIWICMIIKHGVIRTIKPKAMDKGAGQILYLASIRPKQVFEKEKKKY